jgi:pyrroline-5-carboxylate reductase
MAALIVGPGNLGRAIGSFFRHHHVSHEFATRNYTPANITRDNYHHIIITVKPQNRDAVFEMIREKADSTIPIISFMAATPLSVLKDELTLRSITRAMSGLHIERNAIITMYGDQSTHPDVHQLFYPHRIFPTSNEFDIDDATLYSGCFPAILASLIEELSEGDPLRHQLICDSIKGTVKLLHHQSESVLMRRVASEGGVTQKILNQLEPLYPHLRSALASGFNQISRLTERK